ncbi:MAG: cyanoexosortase C [Elainellaceae cyanobacterium]
MQTLQPPLKYASKKISQAARTSHGKIVFLGLVVGLVYFPAWFIYLFQRALLGKSGWFLILGLLGLAFAELWHQKSRLLQLKASGEDKFLGHALILSATLLFPFCRFALWSQAFVWLTVLIGIALSTFGVAFFSRFKLPTFLIGLTVYPRVGLISRFAWEFIVPYEFLESAMASVSASSLRMIGWSASASREVIAFPEGSVIVGWGCNGLDMAITMAILGLFLGAILQQNRQQIAILISTAFVLAFIANIPRLMLVSIAYVYWGPGWFRFWHGFWGGQIFVGVLFTLYYYAVMAYVNRHKAVS